MKYESCADAGFRNYKTYCGYNASCFKIFKTNAKLKEVYDVRDGQTCSVTAIDCPC